MFPKISMQMLHFAENNPTLDIVMRPHPIMFGNLVSSGVRTEGELESWLQDWNALPNTAIDSEGDIAPLFAAADVFVTDGISFLGEYPLATGKPTMFFENEAHWPWSPIGKIAARANIHVHNFDEFVEAVNDVFENGFPDLGAEIAELQRAAQPYPGQAAAKIVEVVREDFEAKTPLVNKSIITEIAWELRPEAEPAWD
jgi:CDP-glycerol glycerophosphotransferase (TagB/SpsB family)